MMELWWRSIRPSSRFPPIQGCRSRPLAGSAPDWGILAPGSSASLCSLWCPGSTLLFPSARKPAGSDEEQDGVARQRSQVCEGNRRTVEENNNKNVRRIFNANWFVQTGDPPHKPVRITVVYQLPATFDYTKINLRNDMQFLTICNLNSSKANKFIIQIPCGAVMTQ